MNKKAFTLIELLVVIAVIGLLSSIIYASVSSARQKAAVTKASSQAREIKNAVAIAGETLLAGTSTPGTLTNTDPNTTLSEKPEIAKAIFPQYEALETTPLGESQLTAALPKVSKIVSGTDEDEEYVYASDGSQACLTSDPEGGSYSVLSDDETFTSRCAPVRCGSAGDAPESIVMYKLDTSNYYPNIEETPGYNINKAVQIYTLSASYPVFGQPPQVSQQWSPLPYHEPNQDQNGDWDTFQMMCE